METLDRNIIQTNSQTGFDNIFRDLAESLREGILITTEEGTPVYANKQAAEITGYSTVELLGVALEELICSPDIADVQESAVVDAALNWSWARIIRKCGDEVTVEIAARKTLWHEEPAIIFIMRYPVVYEEDFMRVGTEDKLRAVAEAAPVPMMVSRLHDGMILYANKQCGMVLSLPHDMLIGRCARDWFYDSAEYYNFLANLGRYRYVHNHKTHAKKADGASTWTICSGQAVVFEGSKALLAGFQETGDEGGTRDVIIDNDSLCSEPSLQSQDLVIDLGRHRVFLKGHDANLTPTEYRLVACLARNAGSLVTQDQLLKEVWGYHYTDKEMIRVSLCRVRRKIGDDGANPRYIITKPGIGYILIERGWLRLGR